MTHLRVFRAADKLAARRWSHWRGCVHCGWVAVSRWEWLVRLRWWAHWLVHVRAWRVR